MRARLELSVDHMLDACSQADSIPSTDEMSSASGESSAAIAAAANNNSAVIEPEFLMSSPAVTSVARRELAPAIRDLMQHGLIQGGSLASSSSSPSLSTHSLIPFMGCMSARRRAREAPTYGSKAIPPAVHAWDMVVSFYELKQGRQFNSALQRKLSQSFGLDLSSSPENINSNKQSLLLTVDQIMTSHGPYKRSPDAHFKAFVCAGLK